MAKTAKRKRTTAKKAAPKKAAPVASAPNGAGGSDTVLSVPLPSAPKGAKVNRDAFALPKAVKGPKHYVLHPGEQMALEAECTRLSKLHEHGPNFFIGQTADMEGHGHALFEVSADGKKTTTHWGTADDYATILNDYANA
jgi:hypothetical protein